MHEQFKRKTIFMKKEPIDLIRFDFSDNLSVKFHVFHSRKHMLQYYQTNLIGKKYSIKFSSFELLIFKDICTNERG